MGCIIFIVSLVLLLWVALLKAMLVDGNKFSIDLITSNLDNLIGYARIWIAAIVTWIVGAVIRVRKPKNKSGKKRKSKSLNIKNDKMRRQKICGRIFLAEDKTCSVFVRCLRAAREIAFT